MKNIGDTYEELYMVEEEGVNSYEGMTIVVTYIPSLSPPPQITVGNTNTASVLTI